MIRFEPLPSLFDSERMTYQETIDTSIASLNAYGEAYPNWIINYSGGKDSSALVGFVLWAVKTGQVKAPESITVLYADTRMEQPPLHITAMKLLEAVANDGIITRIVEPPMDKRFFVYMLGRGVPPPTNIRRWCTRNLKADPMSAVAKEIENAGGDFLNLTGVRQGESAARDNRISVSCSKDGGECGQGWFQQRKHSLAPLLHWRQCYIWHWLYSDQQPYKVTRDIEAVYKADDVVDIRTGCVGCNIVDEDLALKYLVRVPEWAYLKPLIELKDLYNWLLLPAQRKRKIVPTVKADGTLRDSSGVLGPLTMPARQVALSMLLDIQVRANYTLVTDDEQQYIRKLWEADTWPKGWSADDVNGSEAFDKVHVMIDGSQIIEPLLLVDDKYPQSNPRHRDDSGRVAGSE